MISTSMGPVMVAVRGSGPPVVLLHANPGDHRDFDAVTAALAERRTVHALDWPGYGRSPGPADPAAVTAMAYAALLPEILDGLGLDRAVLIGNSVGGYAAARFALRHPDRVTALVLVNSGGFSRRDPLTIGFIRFMGTRAAMRLAAGRLPRLYLRHRTPAVREMIARDAARRDMPASLAVAAALWRSFASPEHDLRARARSITAPVLLVWGTRDPLVGADGPRARHALPAADWKSIPTGHAPFAESPQQFLDLVLPFLTIAAQDR